MTSPHRWIGNISASVRPTPVDRQPQAHACGCTATDDGRGTPRVRR